MTIEAATISDLPLIEKLLVDNRLPMFGLQEHVQTILILKNSSEIIACAAIESYEKSALLRSVAVSSAFRGNGVGISMTKAALNLAKEKGAKVAFLLTETAPGFFRKFGFKTIARKEVDEAVLHSTEFSLTCCDSAAVMKLELS